MKEETVMKCLALLTTAYPHLKFDYSFYIEMWKDLHDESALQAVIEIIKQTTELFPDMPWVGIIRERAVAIKKLKDFRDQTPKLDAPRFKVPPPPEFLALKNRIGKRKNDTQ